MRKLIALLILAIFPSVALSDTILEGTGSTLNPKLNCYTCVTLEDFGKAGVAQIYHDWENNPINSFVISPLFALQRWHTVLGDQITVVNPTLQVEVDIDIDAVLETYSFFGFSFTLQSYTKMKYIASLVTENAGDGTEFKRTNRQVDLYKVIDPKGDRSNKDPAGDGGDGGTLEITADELQRLSAIGVTPEQYKRLSVAYNVEDLENLADVMTPFPGGFDRFINSSDAWIAWIVSMKNGNTSLNTSDIGRFRVLPTTRSFGAMFLGAGSRDCGLDCSDLFGS